MGFCDWCNKENEKLNSINDVTDKAYFICNDCVEKLKKNICRKCGKQYTKSKQILIKGLCSECYQVYRYEEEVNSDNPDINIDIVEGSYDFSDKEHYEMLMTNWMKTFNTESKNYNNQLINLWIMLKAMINNIPNEVLHDNMDDIHIMVNRSFDKIKGKNCNIVIGNDDNIDSSNIIDHLNSSYIVGV